MALLHLLLLAVIIPGYIAISSTRCGTSWADANGNLGRPSCTCCDSECPAAYPHCYASCATTSPPTAPVSPPKAPVSPPKAPVAPPTGGSVGGGTTKKLTLSDLQNFMGGTTLSQAWCDAVNNALSRYGLNTIKRIVAFLAQVRHETAGMTVFHQSADNGGGLLHMTPSNWKACCLAVPEIAAAFNSRYSNCANCACVDAMASSPSGATATDASLNIFSQPAVAAYSAGWWFDAGAISAFGWKGCSNKLSYYCDQGLGSAPSTSDCSYSGMYQLTCCIFWTINEASGSGLTQRLNYYNQACSYAKSAWGWSGSDTAEEVTQYHATPAAINASIAVGCTIGIAALIVVIVIVYLKRKQRIQSEVV